MGGRRRGDRRVSEQFRSSRKEPGAKRRSGKELFADVIGTYLLGPAFAFSSVLQDFDPASARRRRRIRRVTCAHHCAFALAATTKYHDAVEKPTVEAAQKALLANWTEARAAAGQPKDLPLKGELKYDVEAAVKKLWVTFPGATYAGISQAHAVKNALPNQGAAGQFAGECRDILNGAWLARRDDPAEWIETAPAH